MSEALLCSFAGCRCRLVANGRNRLYQACELQDLTQIVALFIEQSGVDDDRTSPRYVEAVSSSWRDAWID